MLSSRSAYEGLPNATNLAVSGGSSGVERHSTYRPTDLQTYRPTDPQTYRPTDPQTHINMLRARQKFGKYTIERKLGEGGFAVVYQARDNIEGIRVALKMPYAHLMNEEALKDFRHEVRVAARLEHPNILPLKYADFIDGRFVIVTALGESTLDERLQRRLSSVTAMEFAAQMLAAVAFAHEHRIIHCDLKPDNFLIFPENRLRLTDFGIARVAQKTLQGSGAGTLGYIAPEQAMGRPSFRSDVFSLGVIFYRIFSGCLPEWPYRWPPPRFNRLRSRVPLELIALIRKAMEVDARKRFRDARQMEQVFLRVNRPCPKARRSSKTIRGNSLTRTRNGSRKWEDVRRHEFQRLFGRQLETRSTCPSCAGPISEAMQHCPWCGKKRGPVSRHVSVFVAVPALLERNEAGLAILPVVLRPRVRAVDATAIVGSEVCCALR